MAYVSRMLKYDYEENVIYSETAGVQTYGTWVMASVTDYRPITVYLSWSFATAITQSGKTNVLSLLTDITVRFLITECCLWI